MKIQSPCITFDQPLWIKAVEIIKSKSMNIVCRLGGFHRMMSFMGSLGTMMKGSGLEEALGCVYGPNAVTHMMSGKAVSRALRGHFLLEAALTNKLLLKVWPSNENETGNDVEDINTAVHKLEATETEKILIYMMEFRVQFYQLMLLVNWKSYASLSNAFLNIKHCCVRNHPLQNYCYDIWSMLVSRSYL